MILNFTSINKLISMMISIVFIISGCTSNNVYIINKYNDFYEVTFFKENGDKLFSEKYTNQPNIHKINDFIYKVDSSTGTDSTYTCFIDMFNHTNSDYYFNLL